MNNKIQELAEQAKLSVPAGLDVNEWILVYNQKFAELIVGQCIAICQDIDGEDNIDARSGRQDCAVEIKEHFGVEE